MKQELKQLLEYETTDIRDRTNIDLHKAFSIELFVPNANKNDCNRLNMLDNHIIQAVINDKPEIPNVSSTFTNQIGEYSSTYRIADREWKVIEKIKHNIFNYTYILEDENGYKDIVKTKEAILFTEYYGTRMINDILKYDKGDIIPKGALLYRATCYDEHLNLMFGTNVRIMYYALHSGTIEDGIVISESASKKFTANYVIEHEISVNTNDILLNLYGDDTEYKPFPEIGEYINNNILCATRRINFDTFLSDFNVAAVKKFDTERDDIIYSKGKVIDISVKSNNPSALNNEYDYLNSLLKYYNMEQSSLRNIHNTISTFIKKDGVESFDNVSDDLCYTYNRTKNALDSEVRWIDKEQRSFDNLILKITVLQEVPAAIGSKISNLFGKLN